ncbi:beta-1,4-galactosyltransferase galt-1-like [Saccostrea cucullata]|uniref:beta-1,4-galactosyltransferase galt-1-like n=1 Tax=Saccostrea cuccullata TaxID=36930 RepID=UPI002ED471BA
MAIKRTKSNSRIFLFLILYLTIYWFSAVRIGEHSKDDHIQFRSRKSHDRMSTPFASVIQGTNDVMVISASVSDSDIKIVSIVDMDAPQRSFDCITWPEDKLNTRINATLYLCPESHGLRFTAAIFSCKVPNTRMPDAVSLVTKDCEKPVNVLPVIYNSNVERTFTVCVSPLHAMYSKAYQLVEMIEFSSILGADHFFFYNYSTNWNVDLVLKHYESKGLVSVIQWKLPMTKNRTDEPDIHYYGQLAMLNDCLNRNRGASRYVVFQDLDEIIIPKNHKSWNDMLDSLPANMSSYMFRSAFFRLDWLNARTNSNVSKIAKSYKAYAFLKRFRENEIFGRATRSKYIVDPLKVEVVGIHNVWKFKRGGRPFYVPPEVALVHHYRTNERETGRVKDDSVLNFKNVLTKIKQTWISLGDIPFGPLN